jgi:tetratricopeptide (TPR) repeat protein
MTEERMRDEVQDLKIILEYDPANAELAARIGKLAITLGDWPMAVDILAKYVNSGYQPILRELGVAMCKQHRDNPNVKEYRQGQEYLEAAITASSGDSDAIASLAGTWKGIDEDKARELYRQAFEVDPTDPYPLGNCLEYEVTRTRDTSAVSLLHPVIETAAQRCREQADVGMNLPWAFYDMGKFYLLLGMAHESLAAYAKAVQLSTAGWMIDTSLGSLEKLAFVQDKLPGYEWARRLLLLGLAAKFPTDKAGKEAMEKVKKLVSAERKPIPAPVVVVAGGCNRGVEQQMQGYRQLMLKAFRDFKGTIISGGTIAAVGKVVAEILSKYPDAIKTIGYIPRRLPAGVRKDSRYAEIRRTEGDGFSPLEPLQYWIDLIASGIPPSEVRLLGINGGTISAAEYRIALALGGQVAVLESGGGEAAKLVADSDWANSKALLRLPADAMTIAAFLGGAVATMEPDIRKTIAQAIHENYRTTKAKSSRINDPSTVSWDKLPDTLKESNLQQADDISNKLRRIGCTVVETEGREVAKTAFTQAEIEIMAEMEHARWNVERLLDGWKWDEKRDVAKKTSPYLVGWANLPEDVKEWDRDTVRKIPEFLAKVGLEIRRV